MLRALLFTGEGWRAQQCHKAESYQKFMMLSGTLVPGEDA
jgi:hypothetical protein